MNFDNTYLDLVRKLDLSNGFTGLNSHTLGRLKIYLRWADYSKREELAEEIRKSILSGDWNIPDKMVNHIK